MRWRTGRRSQNVEDRRGRGGGFGRRMPIPRGGGLKLGGLGMIVVVVLGLFLGADPMSLLGMVGGGGLSSPQSPPQTEVPSGTSLNDEQADFVRVILGDTEDTWSAIFAEHGKQYQAPKLVLFADAVESACGMASAASGPFYCPGDRQVYIDLGFFRELNRLGAKGDFARAYVIAHEIGHHIQNLTGTEREVRQLQAQLGRREVNALSVMMELQADCFAGLWARHAHEQRNLLEQGDVEEGLNAAAAIGDDRLQRMAGKRAQPESFTHGSSEQRVHWFKTGLQASNLSACDTFNQASR